jgi:hypothetical protein
MVANALVRSLLRISGIFVGLMVRNGLLLIREEHAVWIKATFIVVAVKVPRARLPSHACPPPVYFCSLLPLGAQLSN